MSLTFAGSHVGLGAGGIVAIIVTRVAWLFGRALAGERDVVRNQMRFGVWVSGTSTFVVAFSSRWTFGCAFALFSGAFGHDALFGIMSAPHTLVVAMNLAPPVHEVDHGTRFVRHTYHFVR